MKNRELIQAQRFLTDQAEEWELPSTKREAGVYFRDQRPSHPWSPRTTAEAPAGALEALNAACGIENLRQVFIMPLAVRSTGARNRLVTTPLSVLAIGSRAVGLWTEKPCPGVAVLIGIEDLELIEDVTILLYGRLGFIAAGRRLTIRYNTVARSHLEPALLELRKKIAGPRQPVPRMEETPPLPFKWKLLTGSRLARLRDGAPAAFLFASVPARSRREVPLGQLLVINPFEVVYMRDPPASWGARYGVDSFIIPRSRLKSAATQAGGLRITGRSTEYTLPMTSPLRDAASLWLG